MNKHWALAFLGLSVVGAALAADDKKKPNDPNDDANAREVAALEQAHEAVGTIVKVDAGNKSLVFRL